MKYTQRSPLERRIDRFSKPLSDFARAQATGSMLLFVATVFALVWENSGHAAAYHHLIGMPLGIIYGEHYIEADLKLWINEGLMALFFFLLGLELKREMLAGDLVDPKLRRLVVVCAAGGIAVPALLYTLINVYAGNMAGWGVPTATDTAFALGMLTLLRRRIPESLIVFIVGLAIIDDIGAILVIALFYTEHVVLYPLMAAMAFIALMGFTNYAGFRQPFIYILGGLFTWYAVLRSGLHPTLAGVAVAMTVPARPKKHPRAMLQQAKDAIAAVQTTSQPLDVLRDKHQHDLIQEVKNYADHASTPLRRWEAAMELPVALLVLPLFAVANAGVPITGGSLLAVFTEPVGVGIVAGLLLGKFAGISSMCWLALRRGWGALPERVRFTHVMGASLISGMGFTMSTFIATRGLSGYPDILQVAKTAILVTSLLAAALGSVVLYRAGRAEANVAPASQEQLD